MTTALNESDFRSLHEYRYKILVDVKDRDGNHVAPNDPIAEADKTYVFKTLRGFKSQFDPEGAPGCVLGLPGTAEFCYIEDETGASNREGLKFKPLTLVNNLGGKFRIYIPPGTKEFKLDLEIDASVTFACVARLDLPPTRTSLLTITEYDKALADQSVTDDFYKLMRGDERFFANSKTGVINVGGHFLEKDNYKIEKGRWLFVTILNTQLKPNIEDGSEEATGYISAIYKVNASTYPALYNAIKYQGNDNPVSSADQLVEPENYDESLYKSIHDYPIEIYTGSEDSGYGGVNLLSVKLTGVKEQFNPMETPGCVLGFPDTKDKCIVIGYGYVQTSANYDLGLNVNPYDFDNSLKKYKVYIPPGTTEFKLDFYLPGTGTAVPYAVAIRLDLPPKRTKELTTKEYQDAQFEQSVSEDFYKLLEGQELICSYSGRSALNIGGRFKEKEHYKINEGRWLFVNVLNTNKSVLEAQKYSYSLQAHYKVNKDTFRQLYTTIKYDATGNPVSSALLANNGGKGPAVRPVLSGIKVSPANYDVPVVVPVLPGGEGFVGDPNAPPPPPPPEYIFTLEAVPAGAELPRVNVFPRPLVTEIGRTYSKVHYKFATEWPFRTEVGMVNKIVFTSKNFLAEATVTSIPTPEPEPTTPPA